MKKIELDIVALSHSVTQSHNYAVVLGEQEGSRRLPIVIGGFEAQAIAVAMERMTPNRPLTHDLFKNTLELLGAQITEILISDLVEGVFFATLYGTQSDGSPLQVDARSSDAIALAVRFQCPIYTTEAILQSAGVALDSPSKAFTNKRGSLSEYSREELERVLAQVLAKEDYESASKIRDALGKKGG